MLKFLGYGINIFIIIWFSAGVHSRIASISLDPKRGVGFIRPRGSVYPGEAKQVGQEITVVLCCFTY